MFPEAKYQRCTVHFYRNVFSVTPRSKVKLVAKMLKAIHAQESKKAAREKAKAVVEELRAMKLKEAAKKVEDGIEETLTYCDFPSEHWTRIRTNNVIERLNREIRRRTRVVGSFPDGFPMTDQLGVNPLGEYEQAQDLDLHKSLFGIFYGEVSFPFLKGLKYKFNYSHNYRWSDVRKFWGADTWTGAPSGGKGINQMSNIFFCIFKIICNFGNCFSFFKFFPDESTFFFYSSFFSSLLLPFFSSLLSSFFSCLFSLYFDICLIVVFV